MLMLTGNWETRKLAPYGKQMSVYMLYSFQINIIYCNLYCRTEVTKETVEIKQEVEDLR